MVGASSGGIGVKDGLSPGSAGTLGAGNSGFGAPKLATLMLPAVCACRPKPTGGPWNVGIGRVAAMGAAKVGNAKTAAGVEENTVALVADSAATVVDMLEDGGKVVVAALLTVLSVGNSRVRMVVRRILFSSMTSDFTSSSLSGSTEVSLAGGLVIEGNTRRLMSMFSMSEWRQTYWISRLGPLVQQCERIPVADESTNVLVEFSIDAAKRLRGSVILLIGFACGAFRMSVDDCLSDDIATDIEGVRIDSEMRSFNERMQMALKNFCHTTLGVPWNLAVEIGILTRLLDNTVLTYLVAFAFALLADNCDLSMCLQRCLPREVRSSSLRSSS